MRFRNGGKVKGKGASADDKSAEPTFDSTVCFRNKPATDKPDAGEPFLGWLTAPLLSAFKARETSMLFRNEKSLELIRSLYDPIRTENKGKPKFSVRRVVLENRVDVGLNWYVTRQELDCMRRYLRQLFKQRRRRVKGLEEGMEGWRFPVVGA